MNVKLAKTAGFCFGVQRAVDTVYEILAREQEKAPEDRKPIFTFGPIVHNDQVVQKLKSRGVEVIASEDELKNVKNAIVIIRAHGVGKRIYDIMHDNHLEIIDASCPFVRKIQRLVHDHTSQGETTWIAGNPLHPEIQGIVGWADGAVRTIPDPESAERLPEGNRQKIFLVAQTTFNVDKFKVIVDILQKKGYYVNVINTICNATFERQTEAKELAKHSDAMIVIGGSSSSNTKKLFEICSAECQKTQLIQTVKDLELEKDDAIGNVGITAGASTPKEIIEEVLTYVRNEF